MTPPAERGVPEVSRLFAESWDAFARGLPVLLGVVALGGVLTLAAAGLPLGAAWLIPGEAPAWLWGLAALASLAGGLWAATWAQIALLQAAFETPVPSSSAPGEVVRRLREGGRVQVLAWSGEVWGSCESLYRASWGRIAGFSWVCLLWGLVVGGGLLLVLIPGIYMAVALAFAPLVYLREGIGGFEALARSLEYVRGRWWAVSGRLFLAGAASSAPALVPIAGAVLGPAAAPFLFVNAAHLYAHLKDSPAGDLPAWRGRALILGALAGFLPFLWLSSRAMPVWRLVPLAARAQARYAWERAQDPALGRELGKAARGDWRAALDLALDFSQGLEERIRREIRRSLAADLRSDKPGRRLAAARSLEALAYPESAPDLAAAMLGPHRELRPVCRRALEGMGVEIWSIPAVQAARRRALGELGSPDPAARARAAELLHDLGEPEGLAGSVAP